MSLKGVLVVRRRTDGFFQRADEVEPGERVDISPEETVDFGFAPQRRDSVMGLSHGNLDRSL